MNEKENYPCLRRKICVKCNVEKSEYMDFSKNNQKCRSCRYNETKERDPMRYKKGDWKFNILFKD